jgi:hypothetical protein
MFVLLAAKHLMLLLVQLVQLSVRPVAELL